MIATSTYEHRETEYFTITAKNGPTLTLDKDIQYRHFGADTVLTGSWNSDGMHMGSQVALLSRNIILDGSDGAEGILGGRVLISSTIEEDGGKDYHRTGHGQFSYVQFKAMGQFGYTDNRDPSKGI